MQFVAVKAKELRYAVELSPSGELREENGVVLETPAEWSPEHLLLAALIRCSLKSLRYHAPGGGVEVRSASGSARTLVTRRETDGRYAIVEATVELAVELEPEPGAGAARALRAPRAGRTRLLHRLLPHRGAAVSVDRERPYDRLVSGTLAPPRERLDRGEGTGLGRPWLVIVLNDDHNTFEGVAFALASVIPGVSYDGGMRLANRIHTSGQAIVWSGLREQAELYWEQLREHGLTLAPLEQG